MRSPLLILAVIPALALGARAEEAVTAKGADVQPAAAAEQREPVEEVPDAEKPERTKGAIAAMREVLTKILSHLEEARNEKDVIKLNCVNEKLTSVKGLLRISEQSDVGMQEALARRDSEAASHEFEKVSIASRKVQQLFAESEACVGEIAVYAGDTQVDVEVQDDSKTDSTGNVGGATTSGDTRQPPASPFY